MTAAHRRSIAAVVLAVAGLLLGIGAVPASAAVDTAFVRLAHLSPDTPSVDVHVEVVADPDASFTVPGVGYGAVSDYRPLAPGSYVISMRAAGAPADSPPLISTTVDARPGGAYTVAGTGLRAKLALTVLDDSAGTPAVGQASVRVVNAAASVTPAADVAAAGQAAWASGVQFARVTGYQESPPGDWQVTVSAAGGPAATLPVTLQADASYTVLLLDRDGGVAAELHRDGAGAGGTPQQGGGDAGAQGGIGVAAALAVLAAIVVVLAGGLLARRAVARRADR